MCQDELALKVQQLKAELVLFKGLMSNVSMRSKTHSQYTQTQPGLQHTGQEMIIQNYNYISYSASYHPELHVMLPCKKISVFNCTECALVVYFRS